MSFLRTVLLNQQNCLRLHEKEAGKHEKRPEDKRHADRFSKEEHRENDAEDRGHEDEHPEARREVLLQEEVPDEVTRVRDDHRLEEETRPPDERIVERRLSRDKRERRKDHKRHEELREKHEGGRRVIHRSCPEHDRREPPGESGAKPKDVSENPAASFKCFFREKRGDEERHRDPEESG